MRRHWHELTGYIVQSSREFAIVLVLYGKGRNGKTLLKNVVIGLLGSKLVYAAPVAELKSDKWATGHLAGKRIFVDDDVDKGSVLPDGILKTISERKAITGQRKYQDKFEIDCVVVPVLLCNNIPILRDMRAGMLHRFQVIPFDHTFVGRAADVSFSDCRHFRHQLAHRKCERLPSLSSPYNLPYVLAMAVTFITDRDWRVPMWIARVGVECVCFRSATYSSPTRHPRRGPPTTESGSGRSASNRSAHACASSRRRGRWAARL